MFFKCWQTELESEKYKVNLLDNFVHVTNRFFIVGDAFFQWRFKLINNIVFFSIIFVGRKELLLTTKFNVLNFL